MKFATALCLVCFASASLCSDHGHTNVAENAVHGEGESDTTSTNCISRDCDSKNDLKSRIEQQQPNNQKLVDNHHDDHNHHDHDHDDHEIPHDHHDDEVQHTKINDYQTWLAASGAVMVISLCGVFGVLVIPIMQRVFYQHLIQFLIALAVGTLAGDALLHLLPHAFQAGVGGHHAHGKHEHHQTMVWQGFVAIVSIIFFFMFEKLINILGEWRQEKANAKRGATPKNKKLRVVREGHVASDRAVGERLCKHKYSPYCMDDFDLEEVNINVEKLEAANECVAKGCENGNGDHEKTTPESELDPSSSRSLLPAISDSVINKNYSVLPKVREEGHAHAHDVHGDHDKDHDTVIISQHEHVHHGHSHAHSHLHSTPESISSVAWMVIFGDGIHNIADGLAIGAAFAEGYTSGLSTSVAVLCHELPHEIGDFAMLLKAGMSVKQAVFYNIMSSVLAFIGMVGGFLLGTIDHFTPWMFTAVAGIFLYVALVDMMPELSSGHSHPVSQKKQLECRGTEVFLQVVGMSLGACIMLFIALYEDDMKSLFDGHIESLVVEV